MMRTAKRVMALCLSLLVLMMSAAQAEVPFLVYSSDWDLQDNAVEVLLTADVETHMPFDEDRLAMLTPITDLLSLRLVAGEDSGSVSISMLEYEVLSLQYQGNALQLSCLPDVTFTAEEAPMDLLLAGDMSASSLYAMLGLDPRGETLLTDGTALLAEIPGLYEGKGKRSASDTTISGYGKSAYRYDYTIAASQADEIQKQLLSVCPEGWLREIIENLEFSGKQTLRMYYTADNMLLRAEYNGTCGMEDDLRTVKLVVRCKRDDDADRIFVELTSPAKKGKNKNNLTFERTAQTDKSDAHTVSGNYTYTAVKDGTTNTRKGEFELINAFSDTADVISGTMTFSHKLHGAEKFTALTLKPELMISGFQDAPEVHGKITVKETYADRTTEHAVLSVDLQPAGEILWEERAQTVALDTLDSASLEKLQKETAAAIATSIVHPLILLMREDAEWFFRDLPEDAVQMIIEQAEMPVY